MPVKIIDPQLLQQLSKQAAASPRLRTHYNLHESLEDDINRLLIAATPQSYIRPHRHSDPCKTEIFIAIQGQAEVKIYDDNGNIIQCVPMSPVTGNVVMEIPPNTWHSFTALSDDCVMMEIKHGPYQPTLPEEFASWAPTEEEVRNAKN